jgi:bacterioferritin (cytochrome b1)
MFKKQANSIPINEAADFFYQLKHAGFGDPPDETGELEGQFAAPVEVVLQAIAAVATSKLRLAMTYQIYSETIRHSSNTAVGEHLKEHAQNELEFADYLIRRATVLGGPVSLGSIETPPATTDFNAIIRILIRAEQETIHELAQLHQLMGSNPMKFEVEAMMGKDQHHLDDLWQHLPHTANMPIVSGSVDQKLANILPELPEQAQGKLTTPPSLAQLQGPAAGQHKLSAMNKEAYYSYYGYRPYDSWHYGDIYQHEDHKDKQRVKALQGRLNRLPKSERAAFEKNYVKDSETTGGYTGAIGGAALGGLTGAALGRPVSLGAAIAGAGIGALGGGVLGYYGGRSSGRNYGESVVDRSYASKLKVSSARMRKMAADMGIPLAPDTRGYVENALEAREQAHEEEKNYYKQQLQQQLIQINLQLFCKTFQQL